MDSASALLLDLHGRLLRACCASSGRHFEGLASAARCLAKDGRIPSVTKRHLLNIDTTAAYIRHISEPRAECLVSDLRGMLAKRPAAPLGLAPHFPEPLVPPPPSAWPVIDEPRIEANTYSDSEYDLRDVYDCDFTIGHGCSQYTDMEGIAPDQLLYDAVPRPELPGPPQYTDMEGSPPDQLLYDAVPRPEHPGPPRYTDMGGLPPDQLHFNAVVGEPAAAAECGTQTEFSNIINGPAELAEAACSEAFRVLQEDLTAKINGIAHAIEGPYFSTPDLSFGSGSDFSLEDCSGVDIGIVSAEAVLTAFRALLLFRNAFAEAAILAGYGFDPEALPGMRFTGSSECVDFFSVDPISDELEALVAPFLVGELSDGREQSSTRRKKGKKKKVRLESF